MFDIILPVFNSMHHVRACVKSVVRCSTLPFRLYVIDDGSDEYTKDALDALLSGLGGDNVTLLRNETNMGYLRSTNLGVEAGSNPFVLCLNSDTVVTAGHLERLLRGFSMDDTIGVINAVSNWANWTRVCWSIPRGYNVEEFAQKISSIATNTYPDIGQASGFYFAVRREAFDLLGKFDEVYGLGYWEEADFCMRALDMGFRVVVDDGLFIYHHGWGSFSAPGRNENMDKNRRVFMERWGDKFRQLEAEWRRHNPISYVDVSVLEHSRNEPKVLRKQGSALVSGSQAALYPITPKVAQERVNWLRRPSLSNDEVLASLRAEPGGSAFDGGSPRVIYILPSVRIYGGVISVLQLVNQLIMRGHNAGVVTYGAVDEEAFDLFPAYFRPYVFADMYSMLADFPDCDLVVATSWETVYPTMVLKQFRPHLKLVYYVQDFEPYFFPSDSAPALQAARTYTLIGHKVVKTEWLRRLLLPFGGMVHKIPLGLNLDFFHRMDVVRERQVIALARPSSVRRNFAMTMQVYAELHKRRPDIKLALYGIGYDKEVPAFPVRSYGKLSRSEAISKAMNESTVLLDCSTFQGFGRPGLEAMACGAATVLTEEGGITQYAKHEYNCLLVDPNDVEDIVSKVIELFDNADKRRFLIENGIRTALEYSLETEGERTSQLFWKILKGHFDG